MTAALEGGEWSAARTGCTLPTGKTRYPFYRRLGGPQGWSGHAENLIPNGIRSRTVQPVVSCYTNYTTHTHTTAQFLMWHTITLLITAIIYLLLQPTTPTGLALWQFVHPQPSHYKGLHTHRISRAQKELYELASTVFNP